MPRRNRRAPKQRSATKIDPLEMMITGWWPTYTDAEIAAFKRIANKSGFEFFMRGKAFWDSLAGLPLAELEARRAVERPGDRFALLGEAIERRKKGKK